MDHHIRFRLLRPVVPPAGSALLPVFLCALTGQRQRRLALNPHQEPRALRQGLSQFLQQGDRHAHKQIELLISRISIYALGIDQAVLPCAIVQISSEEELAPVCAGQLLHPVLIRYHVRNPHPHPPIEIMAFIRSTVVDHIIQML